MAQRFETATSSPVIIARRNKQLLNPIRNVKRDPEIESILKQGLNIANYYIPYHIRDRCKHEQLHGLPKSFLIPPAQPSELYIHISNLCENVEKVKAGFFDEIPQHVKLRSDNAKQTFLSLCNKIFSVGGINWGRVVTVFTLGGTFAVHFVNKGQLDIVKKIPAWIKEAIENDLVEWIIEQGGWEKIKDQQGDEDSLGNVSWSPYATFCVVAAAGMLLFGLRK